MSSQPLMRAQLNIKLKLVVTTKRVAADPVVGRKLLLRWLP